MELLLLWIIYYGIFRKRNGNGNEILGTNADGTPNEDYCIYCYKDGKFTQDMTMEQMIDHCAQFTEEINRQSGQNLTKEQAKEMMRQFFPHLKRWKK